MNKGRAQQTRRRLILEAAAHGTCARCADPPEPPIVNEPIPRVHLIPQRGGVYPSSSPLRNPVFAIPEIASDQPPRK